MSGEILFSHPRSAYDAIKDRVNFSTLKEMERSPLHYKHALENPKEPTDAMDLGNASHLGILEPERFAAEVVEWTGKVRNGRVWDAFEAAHKKKLILPSKDYAECRAMQKAVLASEQARKALSGGHAEVTLLWEQEVIPGFPMKLKGRIDYLSPEALLDVKTCPDASPDAFGRQLWNMGYLAQAALYSDGYALIRGEQKPFGVVAIEKEPPYVVQVYWLTPAQISRGRDFYMKWLAQLGECQLTNRWPGYATGPMPLVLPAWAARQAEDSFIAEQAQGALP